jgi:hypothetical protein
MIPNYSYSTEELEKLYNNNDLQGILMSTIIIHAIQVEITLYIKIGLYEL